MFFKISIKTKNILATFEEKLSFRTIKIGQSGHTGRELASERGNQKAINGTFVNNYFGE